MQPLRSPGGGESGGLAGSAEDTFIKLWEGWGEPCKPWVWQSSQASGRERSAFVARESFSSAFGLVFPGSFVKPGLLSFDICFPFWIFPLVTSKCSELKPWETLLHLGHGVLWVHGTCGRNPILGLLEARLKAVWCVV